MIDHTNTGNRSLKQSKPSLDLSYGVMYAHPSMGKVETTLFMIKPDAIHRGLGDPIKDCVLHFCREQNLFPERCVPLMFSKKALAGFYKHHVGKSFYSQLEDFMAADLSYAIEITGANAVGKIRSFALSIRNLFGIDSERKERNLVHSSDSYEESVRERGIIFHV